MNSQKIAVHRSSTLLFRKGIKIRTRVRFTRSASPAPALLAGKSFHMCHLKKCQHSQRRGQHMSNIGIRELWVVWRYDRRCIEGGDVKKSALSNKTPTVVAYLRITLGKHKRAPSKKTKVCETLKSRRSRETGRDCCFPHECISRDRTAHERCHMV